MVAPISSLLPRAPYRRVAGALAAVALSASIASCATTAALPSTTDGITDVVATTPILTDLVRNVAGERARVTGLIPPNADPHTHELTLRDVRNAANADVAFTNGFLLEPQAVSHSVHSSVRSGVPVIPVAERAESKGAKLRPLVENLSLDSVWLGLRATGDDPQHKDEAAASQRQVAFHVTEVDGPGQVAAYVTGTFGQPEIFFDSADGLDGDPLGADSIQLPPNAHTHMSWSFAEPGIYTVDVATDLITGGERDTTALAKTTLTFAVGVPADEAPRQGAVQVVKEGHHDVRVDVGQKKMDLSGDGGDRETATTVIEVPSRTLQQVPAQRDFRFLGQPGDETYLLPQAVLGKHVHGDIDPHLWHTVGNAKAMVEIIRDELSRVDPHGAAAYQRNAKEYLDRLDSVDRSVREQIQAIPEGRRHLVTAHDGYAYLADTYGLDIAGFISPNPAVEPSARDVITLTRTLENLRVPAVFVEPTLAGQANSLMAIADRLNVQVCTIRGDTFDAQVHSYEELMLTNAAELRRCLG